MSGIKIGVIGGLGHIGLVHSACLAELGYETIACDIDLGKISAANEGKVPFREPGLQALVEANRKKGRLRFVREVAELEAADVVYICVDTPPLASGAPDTSNVDSVVQAVAAGRKRPLVIALKSTVPVGTARRLSRYLAENGLSGHVAIVSNPEFLREGSAVDDFWHPARIVVGGESEEAVAQIAALYSPPGVPVLTTSWENAELIKYASNAFLALKISFINEIAGLSEKLGGDIRVVSRGIGLDPRISPHFLEAGVGFSGPCLEKDLRSLIQQFTAAGLEPQLLSSALVVNHEQRAAVVRKLLRRLGTLNGKRICVLGMAFKPQTDDVRNSHSLPIVQHLIALGSQVAVYDPWVKGPQEAGLAAAELPGVKWAATAYEAAAGAEGLIILTAWPEFRKLDLERLRSSMARPVIVDGRNLFDPAAMRSLGFDYQGVGICAV